MVLCTVATILHATRLTTCIRANPGGILRQPDVYFGGGHAWIAISVWCRNIHTDNTSIDHQGNTLTLSAQRTADGSGCADEGIGHINRENLVV